MREFDDSLDEMRNGGSRSNKKTEMDAHARLGTIQLTCITVRYNWSESLIPSHLIHVDWFETLTLRRCRFVAAEVEDVTQRLLQERQRGCHPDSASSIPSNIFNICDFPVCQLAVDAPVLVLHCAGVSPASTPALHRELSSLSLVLIKDQSQHTAPLDASSVLIRLNFQVKSARLFGPQFSRRGR